MKVVFLQDVPNLGKAGEIREVADGFGRNYLIPRKLAQVATSEAVKSVAVRLEAEARNQAKTEAQLVELARQLDGREFFLEAQTGGRERLYGSVTAEDIAAEIEKVTGVAVDRRKIEQGDSIRELGSYEVKIRLGKDLVPSIRVTVTAKSAGH